MRLRLGLLQRPSSTENQARQAAESQARKQKSQIPTVKTEAQTKAEEAHAARQREKAESAKSPQIPRIRPLSESKAIDSGANFLSESFLFIVAGGLIVFESFRSRRKETSRREDVADRLRELEEAEDAARKGMVALEKEIIQLKAKLDKTSPKHSTRLLPREVWDIEKEEDTQDIEPQGWLSKISSLLKIGEDRTANNTDARGTVIAQPNSSEKQSEVSTDSRNLSSPPTTSSPPVRSETDTRKTN